MSKVFKNGAGADIVPLDLAGDPPASARSVHAYRLRQVGSRGAVSRSTPETAAEPPRPPAPAPPTPAELETIKKAAYGQGYSDGERAGEDCAAKQLQPVMQSFRKTTAELAAYKSTLRAEAEQELVELALLIARRVIHREVQVDRSSVVGIVRACVERINGAEIQRLRVNPADAAIMGEYFRQPGGSDIEIVADLSVAPGGAILHTSQGQLDARLESQLREIEYGLTDG